MQVYLIWNFLSEMAEIIMHRKNSDVKTKNIDSNKQNKMILLDLYMLMLSLLDKVDFLLDHR